EAVVFADTRSSPVEVVQIIGRALRQEPGEGKISRIIVPVFLEPGEDPGDMMASPSYRGLVAVLQGLRAHDDRIIERMALPTTTARGQITSVLALDPQQETAADENGDQGGGESTAAGAGDESQGPEDTHEDQGDADQGTEDSEKDEDDEESDAAPGIAPVTTPLLRFSLPRDPQAISLFLRTRVLWPDSEIWLTGYNALRTWVREHGHARVPSETTVPLGDDGDAYGLGTWVKKQRGAFKAGTLKPWRADLLNEVGMIWSVGDAAFWKNLAAARAYMAAHGSLAAPKNAMVDGVAVGQWLANLRKPGGLGSDQKRADERRRALEAIDPDWNPQWPVDWQRHYAAARTLLGEEQGLTDVLPGVTVNGVDVGTWTTRQQEPAVWEALLPEQRERLTALGLTALPAAPAPAPAPAAGTFERGIAALTQYAQREGHLSIPRQHTETIALDGQEYQVKAAVFLSNHKSRRAKLSAEKLDQFAALGLDWATTPARQEA
ncbi:Helicase associated domain protein, partial [Streptomyces microflavus]|uniref:helicase associated domain-containing protein n=1 Tax=Streptomyces microflavus TaxID=1919 RepID=UPI0033A00B21